MSIGLSILLSTVLLIAAWQIEKRGAWRKAGKASLWLVAAAVFAGALAYGYVAWWPERKARKEEAAEVARIRNPGTLLYWGVGLGMSKAEVRYLKGDPTETVAQRHCPRLEGERNL